MSKVLVIAVHPDDETLGCGGTLLKHKREGDEIYWLIVTWPDKEDGFDKEFIEKRKEQIKQVTEAYQFIDVIHLGIPTMRVDEEPMKTLIENIASCLNDIKPDTLYLPFKGDVHSDHRRIFEAAFSCTKSFRFPYIKKVLMMETLSETEFAPSLNEFAFMPNHFVDISDYLPRKIEIMKIFESEIGEHPFPRSEENIKALATYRGASCGKQYAESFVLLKEIR